MSWIRAGACLAALGIHAAVAAAVAVWSANPKRAIAFQSGSGEDYVTVSLQSEEIPGSDAAPQTEPAQKQEEQRKEAAVKALPPSPTASERPQLAVQEKPVEEPHVAKDAMLPPQEDQQVSHRSNEARRNELLSQYRSQIHEAVVRHGLLPKKVLIGRVIVELTLSPSGELLGHRVAESSGSVLLDRTAMANLESAAPFPPAPEGLVKESHTMTIPFDYSIK